MIEFPESISLSKQLNDNIAGKTVRAVCPPSKPHKFCWYEGDVNEYDVKLKGAKVTSSSGFGMYVDINFDNGLMLSLNDGTNPRLLKTADAPKAYQLLIEFSDDTCLAFTVAMYGGICLHGEDYANEYYIASKFAPKPGTPEFSERYWTQLAACKPNTSVKAFLATKQRFPGIGNGVIQDILFDARINPRKPLSSLSPIEIDELLKSVNKVLLSMIEKGGRDTQTDIFGRPCGYKSILSKNNKSMECPVCGSPITKEAYLGGAVYYCPICQPREITD